MCIIHREDSREINNNSKIYNNTSTSTRAQHIQSPRLSSTFQTMHYSRDIESIVTMRHAATSALGTPRGMVFAYLEEAGDDNDENNDDD